MESSAPIHAYTVQLTADAEAARRTAGAERPFGTTSMNIGGLESRRRAAAKTAVWTHPARRIAAEPAAHQAS
jgi:hypothetical protein